MARQYHHNRHQSSSTWSAGRRIKYAFVLIVFIAAVHYFIGAVNVEQYSDESIHEGQVEDIVNDDGGEEVLDIDLSQRKVTGENNIERKQSKVKSQDEMARPGDDVCVGRVTLKRYADEFPDGRVMFLTETSGSATLSARQACTVESAGRATGLAVIVLMIGGLLDLSHKITCQLYREVPNVYFRRAFPEEEFEGTPLQKVWDRGDFLRTKFAHTHYSEAFRVLYLFRVSR